MFDGTSACDKIKRAYVYYLGQKRYNKIKVSDIIKTAEINRSTFYRNFDDIFSLYSAVCDELISEIVREIQPVHSSEDIREAAFSAFEKAMEFKEYIRLIAGKNGNRQFLYKLRNEYFNAMKNSAVKAGLWEAKRHYIVSFSADYLILRLNNEISDKYSDYRSYANTDYIYDYDIDPIINISNALKKLNGGNLDMQSAFFLSVIRKFSTGDYTSRSVTELFSFSGFSRTEFYKVYSNRTDYFEKIENALNLILSKTIIPLLLGNEPDCLNKVLDNWDNYHNEIERSAVINGINGGYVLDMGIRVLNFVYNGYIEGIKELRNDTLTPEQENVISFFICSAICCFVYYIADGNRKQYFERINTLFEFKKKMLNEEKTNND